MDSPTNNIVMNQDAANAVMSGQPESIEEIRKDRKEKLSAALRLFGKFGFDEGVAGHITVRDPEKTDHFWVNPMGKSFKQMKVSDLLLVSTKERSLKAMVCLIARPSLFTLEFTWRIRK